MALTSRLNASIAFTQTGAPDLGTSRSEQALSISKTLANGTANGQANIGWTDSRVLASNTAEDIDLAGALTDAFGGTITAAEIVAILIESDLANTTNLTVGGGTSEAQLFFAAAGDKLVLKPGDFIMNYCHAGWPITATSADDLGIANASGAAATYRIGFLARNA